MRVLFTDPSTGGAIPKSWVEKRGQATWLRKRFVQSSVRTGSSATSVVCLLILLSGFFCAGDSSPKAANVLVNVLFSFSFRSEI